MVAYNDRALHGTINTQPHLEAKAYMIDGSKAALAEFIESTAHEIRQPSEKGYDAGSYGL